MMIDPRAWDKCMNYIDVLKTSKRKWVIRYTELIGHDIVYSTDQIAVLSKHKARSANIFWFLKNNKHYFSKVRVQDELGKIHKFSDNEVLLKKLNHFYDWSCSLGVNWLHIPRDGKISGTCGQTVFNSNPPYNFYSPTFSKDFNPVLKNTTCKMTMCTCGIETVMPKFKVDKTKVIPIHAN
jgi:hypothetical protein